MPKNSINPCAGNKCSHICVLHDSNSYRCMCPENSRLAPDNANCIQEKTSPDILLGVTHQIITIEPREIQDKLLHNISESGFSVSQVAYISKSEHIVFADNELHGLFLTNYVGLHIQFVFKTGFISSLSYDYLANNLYWSDSERSTIEVYSFQESAHTIVKHFKDTAIPYAIAVVPENGAMFIALSSNLQVSIDRLNLNGAGDQYHIHKVESASEDFSFAVDPTIQTIFWVNGKKKSIMQMNYDGTNIKELTQTHYEPSGIAVAANRIYWVSKRSKFIHHLDKISGSIHSTISIKLDRTHTKSLSVMSPKIDIKHPCIKSDNGGCSDICVSAGGNENECICYNGREFENDKRRNCIPHTNCFYKCKKTGQCVTKNQICNNENDCVGGDDEADCNTKHIHSALTCHANEFLCADKSDCINHNKVCDGHIDCADYSDEVECALFSE